MNTSISAPCKGDGFTLIEVLIALFVLGVGMFGISTLYIESLRLHRVAIQRNEASVLAADLAERRRAGEEAPLGNEADPPR